MIHAHLHIEFMCHAGVEMTVHKQEAEEEAAEEEAEEEEAEEEAEEEEEENVSDDVSGQSTRCAATSRMERAH